MRTSTGLPRRPRNRWPSFKYDVPATYFITLCSDQKRPTFSRIRNGQVELSPIGRIIEAQWRATATIRSEVILDLFVVMPNHFHALFWLDPPKLKSTATPLGNVVGKFKGAVTSDVRRMTGREVDVWQDGLNDRVIRDQRELEAKREYIRRNPERWEEDEFWVPL